MIGWRLDQKSRRTDEDTADWATCRTDSRARVRADGVREFSGWLHSVFVDQLRNGRGFSGDHLVVGVPAPGALSLIAANIPLPAFANQTFCDAQVQLAPQQFYPNVYVPTAAELSGNFSAFAGLLTDPNNQPYPNGVIPSNQLNSVFAWRIGPAQTTSANGGWGLTGSMTEARSYQTSVLLPSGKVLVSGPDNTAELYDPATGVFQPRAKRSLPRDRYADRRIARQWPGADRRRRSAANLRGAV